jgi:hypothetical protein
LLHIVITSIRICYGLRRTFHVIPQAEKGAQGKSEHRPAPVNMGAVTSKLRNGFPIL